MVSTALIPLSIALALSIAGTVPPGGGIWAVDCGGTSVAPDRHRVRSTRRQPPEGMDVTHQMALSNQLPAVACDRSALHCTRAAAEAPMFYSEASPTPFMRGCGCRRRHSPVGYCLFAAGVTTGCP